MQILKIQVKGLAMFEKTIEIDFYAKKRVYADKNEMLTNVFSNIHIHHVIALIGMNASGKTMTLKVISFVLQLLKNIAINAIDTNEILEGLKEEDEVILDVFFVANDKTLMKLTSIIKMRPCISALENKRSNYIVKEWLWAKPCCSLLAKKDLFDFSNATLLEERNADALFLLDDVSIMLAYHKKHHSQVNVMGITDCSNEKEWYLYGDLIQSIAQFLDPSIAYITYDTYTNNNAIIRLKYKQRKEMVLYEILELQKHLSAGTWKGLHAFLKAVNVLKRGGYVLMDDLEMHLHPEIVSTLIRCFMDHEMNVGGGVLIFSSHRVEQMDMFDRKDHMYLVKKVNGISVENFSDIMHRNDVKKSDMLQSGYLDHTAPSYAGYMNFKRLFIKK